MAKENFTAGWYQYESVLFFIPAETKISLQIFDKQKMTAEEPTKSGKIKLAAFDMDGTLINSNRGEKYAADVNDWLLAYETIPEKLRYYRDNDYFICIISNRKAAINSHIVTSAMQRIEKLFDTIGFQCFAFLLTGNDEYRKPNTGSLYLIQTLLQISCFEPGSFYCGDAAKNYSTNPWHQWSDSDYQLVANWNKENKITSSVEKKRLPPQGSKTIVTGSKTKIVIKAKKPAVETEQCKSSGGLQFYDPDALFDDGYLWQDHLPVATKLIITCGQLNSGYPPAERHEFKNADGVIFLSGEFGIIKKADFLTEKIIVITGSFPTFREREAIRIKFGIPAKNRLVVWFTRPSSIELKRSVEFEYSKAFQSPVNTGEIWIRGN